MTESTVEIAQKEFSVIRDLLLVPLKPDLKNEELPSHRKWRSGCIPAGLPDLVPVKPPSDREGLKEFCNLREGEEGEKLLVVTVENRGNATAPQSTTRVTFVDLSNFNISETSDKTTPEIPAGKSIELEFDMQRCSNSNCLFIITVNAKFEIDESDLTNNVAIGLCRVGPL
ncbi:CARDB protein [Methanosarcina thermophila]|jgi:hypothetical protein|uniref:CARDB protein n=3 Tax=Methanosarcina thermophila TaxID=2210 RepID=A0A1I7A6C4_METTE|nr:CARDB domain-containing protein [Methanosarcina thermophila]ALK05531.1 MAG: hypothetical protein AAY43_07205 [Methanosarcina sp. 795]AKB11800.1 hypothetical protein MSTHT_0042 [Methanosarcina thermophila TM-1]AKB15004.1 hypothetical protein MSTHC_0686 [Methanosarcina thermophila CHTI-55]NLU57525.1 hypothetical protein [Methanosarcina thermophila]SFT70481.1 CARDB protein [Methanosarcina thermophila]